MMSSSWGPSEVSVDVGAVPLRRAKNFPLYRTALGFIKDPLQQLERMGEEADGG